MATTKQMNHAEYQAKTANMSYAELMYVIKDCKEAIAAQPENANNSYYADEICYCGMELRKRQTR